MIIGVDGNEANVRERVGVSVYTFKHLFYFQKMANQNVRFIVFLKQSPFNDLPDETEYFKYCVVEGSFFWSLIHLPLALLGNLFSKEKINVFFSPAHYTPALCFCPLVVTIHDVAYLHFPDEFLKRDLYQLKNWTSDSLKKSSKVITVSKTTKKDVINYYHIPESEIEVIYNGFEKEINGQRAQIDLSKMTPPIIPPYILHVGTIQPRKNIITLIRAMTVIHKTLPDFKLVITGKKGWLFDQIFREARNLYLENKIIFTGYVTDEELVHLYKNAFCFVLPSLYEGFGIPILEAMSFGCPVISSFSSSLTEVGKEAALYFDPTNHVELSDKVIQLERDKKLRTDLIKKGAQRIKQFSWDLCAKETLKVLMNIANDAQ